MTPQTTLEISLGETLLFGVLAVVMIVLAVFGLLITRRAVYSAMCVIANMVCLAFLYTMLEAPFMGVVQVAVYTGAILMMFLFVLMMIGVDAADSTHETVRGTRAFAVLGGLGFLAIGVGAVMAVRTPEPVGLKAANAETNPGAIARAVVGNHVLALELAGTLLIVAALGAMTLTHRERIRRRVDQPALQEAKMRAYAERGRHIGQKPPTGVYAESNSAADPALTVGGEVEPASVSRVLRIRGQVRSLAEASPITAVRASRGELDGVEVTNARMAGMPGEGAPDYGLRGGRKADSHVEGPAAKPEGSEKDGVEGPGGSAEASESGAEHSSRRSGSEAGSASKKAKKSGKAKRTGKTGKAAKGKASGSGAKPGDKAKEDE